MCDVLACSLMTITSINRNELLVQYPNLIVPIVSMLFKYNSSIFLSILKHINNNENIVFSGLIFPIFIAFQQTFLSVVMQSPDRHD